MNVKNMKTVFISDVFYFDNEDKTNFFKNIQIPFKVDEIILKYVSFINTDANLASFGNVPFYVIIKSDLIYDRSLVTLPYYNVENFHNTFDIPFKPSSEYITGLYKFTIQEPMRENVNIQGNEALLRNADEVDFSITFCLIFVEYEKKSLL